jgi:WD40 repeat protein
MLETPTSIVLHKRPMPNNHILTIQSSKKGKIDAFITKNERDRLVFINGLPPMIHPSAIEEAKASLRASKIIQQGSHVSVMPRGRGGMWQAARVMAVPIAKKVGESVAVGVGVDVVKFIAKKTGSGALYVLKASLPTTYDEIKQIAIISGPAVMLASFAAIPSIGPTIGSAIAMAKPYLKKSKNVQTLMKETNTLRKNANKNEQVFENKLDELLVAVFDQLKFSDTDIEAFHQVLASGMKEAHLKQAKPTDFNHHLASLDAGASLFIQLLSTQDQGLAYKMQAVKNTAMTSLKLTSIVSNLAKSGLSLAALGPVFTAVSAFVGAARSIFANNQATYSLSAQMNRRFTRLEAMLGEMYSDIMTKLGDISFNIKKLHNMTAHLQYTLDTRFDQLEQFLMTGLVELFKYDFKNMCETIKLDVEAVKGGMSAEFAVSKIKYRQYTNAMITWGTVHAKTTISTTISSITSDYDFSLKTIQQLSTAFVEQRFGFLAYYFNKQFGSSVSANDVANPIIWAQAAYYYMYLRDGVPDYDVEYHNNGALKNFQNFIDTGKTLQRFVHDIQSEEQLFPSLLKHYKNDLNTLRFMGWEQISNAIAGEDNEAKRTLNRLNANFLLLNAFSHLAFNVSYWEDNLFAMLINPDYCGDDAFHWSGLLRKQNIEVFAKMKNKLKDKVYYNFYHFLDEGKKRIELFETLVTEKQGSFNEPYILVETMLNELSAFEENHVWVSQSYSVLIQHLQMRKRQTRRRLPLPVEKKYIPSISILASIADSQFSFVDRFDFSSKPALECSLDHPAGRHSMAAHLFENHLVTYTNVPGSTKIWDLDTEECWKTLQSSGNAVPVASGKYLAIHVGNNTEVWDIKKGKKLRVLQHFTVKWAGIKGDWIFGNTASYTTMFYNIETGKNYTIKDHFVSFDPETLVARTQFNDFYDIRSQKLMFSIERSNGSHSLGRGIFIRPRIQNVVKPPFDIYDTRQKEHPDKKIFSIDNCNAQYEFLLSHHDKIIGRDTIKNEIHVWDIASKACKLTIKPFAKFDNELCNQPTTPAHFNYKLQDPFLFLVYYNPHTSKTASWSEIWNINTGKKTCEWKHSGSFSEQPMPLAFYDNRAISYHDGQIKVWSFPENKTLSLSKYKVMPKVIELDTKCQEPYDIKVYDNRLVRLSGSRTYSADIWDIETKQCLQPFSSGNSLVYSHERFFARLVEDKTTLEIWDLPSVKKTHKIKVIHAPLDFYGDWVINSLHSGSWKYHIYHIPTGNKFMVNRGGCAILGFDSDRGYIYINYGGQYQCFNVRSPQEKAIYSWSGGTNRVAKYPDIVIQEKSNKYEIWDIGQNKAMLSIDKKACDTCADHIEVTEGHQVIALNDHTGEVTVWDLEKEAHKLQFKVLQSFGIPAFRGNCSEFYYKRYKNLVAVINIRCNSDTKRQMELWDTNSGEKINTWKVKKGLGRGRPISFFQDDKIVVSSEQEGKITVCKF